MDAAFDSEGANELFVESKGGPLSDYNDYDTVISEAERFRMRTRM